MSDELIRRREEERARQAAWLREIATLLDIPGTEIHHQTLKVEGLSLWLSQYRSQDVAVLRTGYFRRGGERRFRNTEPAHLAAALRRIIAERAEKNRQASAYMAGVEASQARTEAAGQQVRGMVERIKAGHEGLSRVHEWEADEIVEGEGRYRYEYSLELARLSEAQALAILAIVEATHPVHWPAAPAAEGRVALNVVLPPADDEAGGAL